MAVRTNDLEEPELSDLVMVLNTNESDSNDGASLDEATDHDEDPQVSIHSESESEPGVRRIGCLPSMMPRLRELNSLDISPSNLVHSDDLFADEAEVSGRSLGNVADQGTQSASQLCK
ncbi:hypothetical protein VTO73DRAFT_13114 [Trametes versicolor]